jgi:hypothetical protein
MSSRSQTFFVACENRVRSRSSRIFSRNVNTSSSEGRINGFFSVFAIKLATAGSVIEEDEANEDDNVFR